MPGPACRGDWGFPWWKIRPRCPPTASCHPIRSATAEHSARRVGPIRRRTSSGLSCSSATEKGIRITPTYELPFRMLPPLGSGSEAGATSQSPSCALRNLDRVYMYRPQHVRPENHPFHIGRKRHVGFQPVVVFTHVDQPLRLEETGVDQSVGIGGLDAGDVRHALGPEQIDPFAVWRSCHHFAVTAVSRE